MTKVLGVIPARLASSRLSEKMLLAETGKPLIQYAWEAAIQSEAIDEVLIATDSDEIAEVARKFGAWVVMTGEHPSGTSRAAEAVSIVGGNVDVVVNIQGDEPEIDPEDLEVLVHLLQNNPNDEMATLATLLTAWEDVVSEDCVKVVCAEDNKALYFSRSVIPFYPSDILTHGSTQESPWKLHVGVYAYQKEFLVSYPSLPEGVLGRYECLEQLRALEAGATIRVGMIASAAVGIDTREDYDEFVRRVSWRLIQ